MKKIITITLLSLFTLVNAQTNAKPTKGLKITYTKSSNGKLIENQDPIFVFTNPTETLVTTEKMNSGKADFPFEQTLINRTENKIVQVTQLKKGKGYKPHQKHGLDQKAKRLFVSVGWLF